MVCIVCEKPRKSKIEMASEHIITLRGLQKICPKYHGPQMLDLSRLISCDESIRESGVCCRYGVVSRVEM